MSNLETAAVDLLVAIQRLEGRVTTANGELNQLRDNLSAIDDQCDSIWDRLEQQVTSFLEELSEKKGVLHELGRDAAGTLGSAREAVDQAYTAAEGEAEEGRAGIDRLQQGVAAAEPEVTAMLERLQAASRSLQAQLTAAEQELQQATEEARTFIETDAVAALRTMQQEVRDRAQAVCQAVLEECQVPVEEKEIDWSAKLAEVMATVEDAFRDAAGHAERVASFSIEQCQQAFTETLNELGSAAETLEKAMEALVKEAEEAAADATEAANSLDSGVQDTIDALGGASSSVLGALATLAKYSFLVL